MKPADEKFDPLWNSIGADFPGRDALIVQSRNLSVPVPGWWTTLIHWPPSDAQVVSISAWILRAGPIADRILKTAVVCACLYLAFEVAMAFLPGGPVAHILQAVR